MKSPTDTSNGCVTDQDYAADSPNDDGALFVMPRSSRDWAGAAALWITVAGWAAAAERRFGNAWVLTPDAIAAPDEVLTYTDSVSRSNPHRTGLRRLIPPVGVTVLKDAREFVRRRKFQQIPTKGPWVGTRLRFVWQQHDIFSGPGASYARQRGVPLVAFVHAPVVWEAHRWGVRRPLWGRLIERYSERPSLLAADLVACVSEEVGTELRRLGVSSERIFVTPMSVDASRFYPTIDGQSVRSRLNLGGAFVVGWTGSFRQFHGLDVVLHAFACLLREHADARLLLVGEGLERPAVQRLAVALGIEHAVVFPGVVGHREIPQYIAAMDTAVVSASSRESFHYSPLKLREYMLCGKPAIAPAVGEMQRGFRDGVNVIHYEPGDVMSLHRAMRVVAFDPKRAGAVAKEGYRVAITDGTWDAQLERLLAALGTRDAPAAILTRTSDKGTERSSANNGSAVGHD